MNSKKPLTLICVQPCIPYYAWQLEVMLTNFTELNIHQVYDIHILCAYNENDTKWQQKKEPMHKVESKFQGKAQFFFYQDTRPRGSFKYISGVRPNILKQHYQLNRDLIANTVFYHDCDIVFTKFPDFLENYIGKTDWYVSDTRSYIGYNYIISKGEDVFTEMTDIVGISKELVQSKQDQSGGCQYIMSGVDEAFFEKMERDCEKLFSDITSLNQKKKAADPTHHEIQIWCADMWAILWGGWLRGYNTHIIPELSFVWATDSVQSWDERYIFHNAGVVSSLSKSHFYKSDFREKYPYNHDGSEYDTNKASYKYFEIIQSIGKNSCLL
jgi:hypothetical protein